MEQGEIILYQPDEAVKLEVRLEDETVWLTQEQIADLFGTTEVVTQCEGCLKDDIRRHNGVYCQIKDWHATDKATGKKGKRIRFIDLKK